MECAKIKQLLSGYIKGALDAQKEAIVEGHLANCRFCSEKLALLKPHLKRRIKNPLKAAAILAIVALAIFIFKVAQPLKIEPKEKVVKTAASLEAEPAVVLEEPREPLSVPIKEEKPIELALLIEPTVSKKENTPFAQRVRLTDVLAMSKNLISILEGEVISVEYKEGTKIPQHIIAKIPSKNYKTFLQKLALYGSMENPPGAAPLTEGPVSVKIELVYSES